MNTDNTFQTDSFLLACYLLSQSCNLISVDRNNPRRMVFVFEETAARKTATDDFMAYRTLIEPHRFYSAQKDLKTLIYQRE